MGIDARRGKRKPELAGSRLGLGDQPAEVAVSRLCGRLRLVERATGKLDLAG
jgi:hypothetical protein